MSSLPIVKLRPGKESLLTRRHPWIFSGALQRVVDAPVVRIADGSGRVLAVGTASAEGALAVRIFRWEDAPLDEAFFRAQLEQAVALRRDLGLLGPNTACRLVFGESDGLPGLIIDRYAHALVVQVGTSGLDALRPVWWPALQATAHTLGVSVIVERSASGRRDGVTPSSAVLMGALAGPITIQEGPARLSVDLMTGQKTGLFLDQREQRALIGQHSRDARVLNVFGYTGGFSIHAGLGGAAHVQTLDQSAPALALATQDWAANGLDPARHEALEGNAFELMRALPERSYDRVIVDPPAFAKQRKDVQRAFKAYKDVFRLGATLTRPGGMLWCYSCSQHMDAARLQEAVWTATLEAERRAQVLAVVTQPPDHPCSVDFPEGMYLKGLWLRVL